MTTMTQLTDVQEATLRLYVDGLSYPEIAEELGIHRSTVKQRMMYIRSRLGVPVDGRRRDIIAAARAYGLR